MSDVKTLGSAERVRLMSEWHGKAVRYRPDATVHGLFREVCAASPDSPALIWDQGQLNYRQLDRISDVLACRLADLGVGADSAVAICLPRSPEAIIAALAVFKAGGAYVPLDPEYPRARLEFVINDARIGVVITGPAGAGRCSPAYRPGACGNGRPNPRPPRGDPRQATLRRPSGHDSKARSRTPGRTRRA